MCGNNNNNNNKVNVCVQLVVVRSHDIYLVSDSRVWINRVRLPIQSCSWSAEQLPVPVRAREFGLAG